MRRSVRTCMALRAASGGPGNTDTLYSPPGSTTELSSTRTRYLPVSLIVRFPWTTPGESGDRGTASTNAAVSAVSFHSEKLASKPSSPPAAATGMLPY